KDRHRCDRGGASRLRRPCRDRLVLQLHRFETLLPDVSNPSLNARRLTMANSSPIPAGKEGMIPHLTCAPCAAAIDFYKKAFGAEELMRMPAPDGRVMHAAILIDGRPLFLADDFPEYCGGKASSPKALGGTPVTVHRYVKECDAAIKRAQEAGAKVKMPATDMFWGDRYGVCSVRFMMTLL